MHDQAAVEPNVFPECGARARMIRRFERDLQDWLSTPHGRFAAWRAARAVDGAPPLPCERAHRHGTPAGVRAPAGRADA